MSSVEVVPDGDGMTWRVLVRAESTCRLHRSCNNDSRKHPALRARSMIVDLSGCLYIDSTGSPRS
jgi:hypothetical protein